VVAQLLIPQGYRNVTINNVPDDKDHIYGPLSLFQYSCWLKFNLPLFRLQPATAHMM
jgi:hypothetical protein